MNEIQNPIDNQIVYDKHGVSIHMSSTVYNTGFQDILFPSNDSWKKAEKHVEGWIHVKTNDKLIGHRFLVGEEFIAYHTKDVHLFYVLAYEGDKWSRHISVFWEDEQPYYIHVNMFDTCTYHVFNGLWEGIEGEQA